MYRKPVSHTLSCLFAKSCDYIEVFEASKMLQLHKLSITCGTSYSWLKFSLRAIIHPKVKMYSATHPHVTPNLEHKIYIF